MQVITTTQLRTQTKRLVQALEAGEDVTLIHRSKILGKVVADADTTSTKSAATTKVLDPEAFAQRIEALGINKQTTHEEREQIYRQHLEEKYGKPVPGR